MYRAWASSRRQGLLVVGAWAAPSSLASPSTFFGGQVPGQGIFVITPAHQQTYDGRIAGAENSKKLYLHSLIPRHEVYRLHFGRGLFLLYDLARGNCRLLLQWRAFRRSIRLVYNILLTHHAFLSPSLIQPNSCTEFKRLDHILQTIEPVQTFSSIDPFLLVSGVASDSSASPTPAHLLSRPPCHFIKAPVRATVPTTKGVTFKAHLRADAGRLLLPSLFLSLLGGRGVEKCSPVLRFVRGFIWSSSSAPCFAQTITALVRPLGLRAFRSSTAF